MPHPATRACPDCGGPMTAGFPLDEMHGGRRPAYWVDGEAERSFLLGTKLRGKAIFKIEGFRCEVCGLLQMYAGERRR